MKKRYAGILVGMTVLSLTAASVCAADTTSSNGRTQGGALRPMFQQMAFQINGEEAPEKPEGDLAPELPEGEEPALTGELPELPAFDGQMPQFSEGEMGEGQMPQFYGGEMNAEQIPGSQKGQPPFGEDRQMPDIQKGQTTSEGSQSE